MVESESVDSGDPLLSVAEVARHFGVSIATVARLVDDGTILSLDRARLTRQKEFDVPLIRLRWAEAIRVPSPGAERCLDPGAEGVPEAVEVAFQFQSALSAADGETIFRLSSTATKVSAGSPEAVVEAWKAAVGRLVIDSTGIATGAYRLTPIDALGFKVVKDPPALPTVYDKPTPVDLAAVLPLVRENEGWRADLELWKQQERLQALIVQPLPK